ncbi:MAG: hypothetical protein BWY61_00045 [Firmicutes bacterium ADurb.Bin354]|nr:MAG: hypothetical protein BWY61_00045 [Firmicutes bacterium ADurb.Bin354]
MNIFDFQKMNKTKETKRQALSKMSETEVKDIISSCGTPQGKKYIKKMWSETHK